MAIEPSRLQFSNSTVLSRIVNHPPFYFEGVTMRIFPVRANLATVRQFCENYINFVPGEIARYDPFVPFVYVCLINYGRMQQVQSVGWVAQNEIAFTIPLRWYRRIDGEWRFQDFVSFSPFIFVDIEMSEITGREVYGWPKEFAFLSRELNSWARNPRRPRNLLTVERRLGRSSTEKGWRRAPFLDVLRRPAPSFSLIPTEFRNPFNPVATAARMAWGSWYVFRTLAEVAASSPLRGFSAIRPENVMAQLTQVAGSSSAMAAGPFAPWGALQRSLDSKTMNLKQFHMARDPRKACYQALVHADMRLERFNRGGLLGDSSVLQGDPTGGFVLRLHRRTAANLIDALGLESDSAEGSEGERVAVFRPMMPFWVDLDLQYKVGNPIGWRVLGEQPMGKKGSPNLRWRAPDIDGSLAPVAKDHGSVRDARAVAWEASIGPYFAPKVASRVMSLRARHEVLESFCEKYLNAPLEAVEPPERSRFEAWGDRVFLIASNYDSITDGNGKVSSWVHRELTFMVPVVWRKLDGRLLDVGFTVAYLFADSDIETIMLRERIGLPVVRGALRSPESIWMQEFQPDARDVPLLELKTEVQGSFSPGEEVRERTLLEIEVSSHADPVSLEPPGADGGARQRPDPRAVAAAVKALAGSQGSFRVSRFTLKQYPDAHNAKRACYQALIRCPEILQAPEVVPFGGPGFITVAIQRYPSFPIVDTLGLEVNRSATDATISSRRVDYIVPEEAFWVRSDTRFEHEEGFLWAGREGAWTGELPEPVELPFDPDRIDPGTVVRGWMSELRGQETDPGRNRGG